jgi:hypothetical protein
MKSIVPPPTPANALSVAACSKQQPAAATRRGSSGARPLLLPLVLSGLLACAAGEACAAYLTPIGGGGGNPFDGGCPPDQNLGGFELRTGDYIDAIRPVCVISLGPKEIRVAPVQPPFFGGPGGGSRRLVCPPGSPIVIGLSVVASGKTTITVAALDLKCGQAVLGAQPPYEGPSVFYHGPFSDLLATYPSPEDVPKFRTGSQSCPTGQVAIGVHGTSGKWLDAMGLICGAPRMTAPAVGGVPPLPDVRAVRQAATTVPPAPALAPVNNGGRPERAGKYVVPGGPFVTPPGPPGPSCDVKCRAELASRGEAIANRDPLSAELRRRASNGVSRRGFDIGMAAAEKDTAPGAGKQAIHNALSGVEQAAFDAAVSFSIQRNRNAQLAATGASIAKADPVVMQARTADKDVFFWLGFDIATGIFGDKARGALGNTAEGIGSRSIRDALDPVAQRGFNASADLLLRRRGVNANLSGAAAANSANGSKPGQLSAVAPLANPADRVTPSAITTNSRNAALLNQGKVVAAAALSPTTPVLSAPSPLGAGGAALMKPASPMQIGGAPLNQPVTQAPAAIRSRQQKVDGVSLNPQPLPPDPPEALTREPRARR